MEALIKHISVLSLATTLRGFKWVNKSLETTEYTDNTEWD
jgi:hypothetical protein